MSQGLREVLQSDLDLELESVLSETLLQYLRARGPGHCMRVSNLEYDLASKICQRMRNDVSDAAIFVLRRPDQVSDGSHSISGAKLIELRNPREDGSLGPPLMIFIPHRLRTSSEDSFGIATFEDIVLGDVYVRLEERLSDSVPDELKGAVADIFRRIDEKGWPWADNMARARFLLTIKLNQFDPEVVGGALFELGLIPDFKLLENPAAVSYRINRNLECARGLTFSGKSERSRVLELGLNNRGFRAELGNFFAESESGSPREWTRRIVMDRGCWPLSFDKWKFEDPVEAPEEVFVEVLKTDLPVVRGDEEDSTLERLIGQQILPAGQKGFKKFGVTFRTDPRPSDVRGLAKFSIRVISRETGTVSIVKNKSAWKTNRDRATVTFTKLDGVDWEDGWHFIRIDAYTEDDEPVPLVDAKGVPLPRINEESEDASTFEPPNESELFYVLADRDVEIEPVQRAVPQKPSLTHAKLDLQFSAILDGRDPADIVPTEIVWTERGGRGRMAGLDFAKAKFGRHGAIHIPVSNALKELEGRLLDSPETFNKLGMKIHMGVVADWRREPVDWPECEKTFAFVKARKEYFEAIRGESGEFVSQTADFQKLRPFIATYATAYMELIQDLIHRAERSSETEQKHLVSEIRKTLAVDSVMITLVNHRGEKKESALLGPTHPLRSLWFAAWAELGQAWLASCDGSHVGSSLESLLEGLSPTNFPPFLPVSYGRLFTAAENVHPFWSLYAPNTEEDPRGLIGDIREALGLPESHFGGDSITGNYLSAKIRRYVIQHPYLRTLSMNVFNPGRAGILSDMLLELQKTPELSDLNYDIRIFVPDPETSGVGESLIELLSPVGTTTTREADSFSIPSPNHLIPKLGLAIRSVADFKIHPGENAAHVTILFDVFPAEEIRVEGPPDDEASAPLHGLFQSFSVQYTEDRNIVAWTRKPRHGTAHPPDEESPELADLLSRLPELISSATAIAATGQTGMNLRPAIMLSLDAENVDSSGA